MNNIKYLVMDVDGTLTDGFIYMSETGEMFKAFSVKDGCGINDIAKPNGIIPIIITGRKSLILTRRCEELGIENVYQGVDNKTEVLTKLINELYEVAYIGDDINDLACMMLVKESGGLIGCPNDAAYKVKEIANFISDYNGGKGAVRDFIEWIVNNR